MKNCNLGDILKSPAVTILVGTICIAFLMSQTERLVVGFNKSGEVKKR